MCAWLRDISGNSIATLTFLELSEKLSLLQRSNTHILKSLNYVHRDDHGV
jgi:hypothetical protein